MALQGKVRGSRFLTSAPPNGLGIEFWHDGERVIAHTAVGLPQEGPPKHAHGGFLASLIDEAMGAAAWLSGHAVVAVHLDFDYRRAVPIGAPITVTGRVERHEGRKVFTVGTITLADDSIAVEGRGIFVEAPQFFHQPGFTVSDDTLSNTDDAEA